MRNSLFNVGQQVKCIEEYDENYSLIGRTGIVKKVSSNWVYVAFPCTLSEYEDDIVDGHSLDGMCDLKTSVGWVFQNSPRYLQLVIPNPKIDKDYEQLFV